MSMTLPPNETITKKRETALPMVSLICPTYNRVGGFLHLLEEAIYSFLMQNYDHDRMELIVINDTPGQQLKCTFHNVRIINCEKRFKTLGEKYNAAIDAARGSVIFPWEDDDISLPNRVTQGVEQLGDHGYWNPQKSWFYNSELRHDHSHGVCHNASCFTKDAWREVGGYPHVNGSQDAKFDYALRQSPRVLLSPSVLNNNLFEWQYVYRWGVSNCHLSGNNDHEAFYSAVGNWAIRRGEFQLFPTWWQPWHELCAYRAASVQLGAKCNTCP